MEVTGSLAHSALSVDSGLNGAESLQWKCSSSEEQRQSSPSAGMHSGEEEKAAPHKGGDERESGAQCRSLSCSCA